jgi:hypothetical protein
LLSFFEIQNIISAVLLAVKLFAAGDINLYCAAHELLGYYTSYTVEQ